MLPAYVERLEGWCDEYNEPLEKLRSFILPGGTRAASLLHVARTVARRAERSGWAAYEQHADTMNVVAITYLNRLSDLLFILARYANREQGDVLWSPGGEDQSARASSRPSTLDSSIASDRKVHAVSQKLFVVGAGLMGSGIAQVAASAGWSVDDARCRRRGAGSRRGGHREVARPVRRQGADLR